MDESRNRLRAAMQVNAGLSAVVGVLLAVAPASVSSWLGLSIAAWLRLLGIVLLGHAVVLVLVVRNSGTDGSGLGSMDLRRWATFNLLAIAPYPLLMIGVVATGLVDRPLGIVLVLLDGFVVGLIGWAHGRELRSRATATHAQVA